MQVPTFSSFGAKSWREGQRLEPHTHDAWSYWAAANPRAGDTEARLQMRLATNDALNLAPRDPRFYKPDREAAWQNASPLYGRFIPEYGITDDMACIGQAEEHVRRPTLASSSRANPDFVTSRTRAGRRTTPLIAYNSIGWNRRHYEPLPDNSRPHSSMSPYEGRKQTDWSRTSSPRRPNQPFAPAGGSQTSRGSSARGLGGPGFIGSPEEMMAASAASSNKSKDYQHGFNTARGIGDEGEYEPPRISGVDTASRPPLVVHSKTRVYRPPWIGISY